MYRVSKRERENEERNEMETRRSLDTPLGYPRWLHCRDGSHTGAAAPVSAAVPLVEAIARARYTEMENILRSS